MDDLSVEVRHNDIIVTQPGTGRCVTYRREANSQMLEAICSMRSDPNAETLQFLTEAWKAAYAKAKALRWLQHSPSEVCSISPKLGRVRAMRLASVKQEARHREYRIEGVKEGKGTLLRVTPTRPDLPILEYSRFRTIRGTWVKAVDAVCGYIDEAFRSPTAQTPQKESLGACSNSGPTVEPHVDELLQFQAQLLSEISRPSGQPMPRVGHAPRLRLAGKKGRYE